MPRPRLGFLGVGWIGRNRMAAMLATGTVEAAAVVEPDPEMLAGARALAPEARVCADYGEMLALGLDGIVIASPSALHAGQSIAALQAGAAVFCQKPLGRSAAEVEAVLAAARGADRLLGVDLSYRHTAAAQAIAPLVREGALGRVYAVDLVFHNGYGPGKPWFFSRAQSGGGCVIDLGVHLVDLALWVLGFPEIARVEATLLSGGRPLDPHGDAVEDYAVASLVTADGASIRLACSWNLQAGQEAEIGAAFYGTGGGAALRNVGGSFYDFAAVRHHGTTSEGLVSPPDDWGGRAASAWAGALAAGARYDAAADRFADVARVLDRILAGGG